jgi:hypothetical protein
MIEAQQIEHVEGGAKPIQPPSETVAGQPRPNDRSDCPKAAPVELK